MHPARLPCPPPRLTQVGPLQREHVLRLLRAPAFTRQLAGVRLLGELVKQSFQQAQALPQGVEVRERGRGSGGGVRLRPGAAPAAAVWVWA